jgi:hypothetical protein
MWLNINNLQRNRGLFMYGSFRAGASKSYNNSIALSTKVRLFKILSPSFSFSYNLFL